MSQQNYSNHVRYYAPHHFIFYPVLGIGITASAWMIIRHPGQSLIWAAIAFIIFLIGWLSFMMRQHYALVIQNRVVRLELRLRYYQLTQRRFEEVESHLGFAQRAALRFASDEELPLLVDRTIKEHLSPRNIKRAIKNWLPDHMRV
jgi:hypothetical protein